MSIASLFQELEEQTLPTGAVGTLERRIRTASACDLFVAVRKPENARCIRVRFSAAVEAEAAQLPTFRGLAVSWESTNEDGRDHLSLVLKVANPAFGSVFTSLAEDIARHVSQMGDEGQAAGAFFGRLLQWQRLLERQGAEGLEPEAQRGLYGELWFLREHIISTIPILAAVNGWTGPDRAAKDFQFPGCAIEVKTTTARQHQHLQITSEKQLDDAGLGALFLCHLSLEATQGTGEALPQMVSSLRHSASASCAAAQALEDRLLESGYLDIHEALYATAGYLLRSANLYRVREGFPRIVERDLPPGVGDVQYSVSAAECQHHVASGEEMKRFVRGDL